MTVTWIGSPFYGYPQGAQGRNGNAPRAIVLHIAQGTMAGVDAWFNSPENLAQNGGSSAHYCVGKNGEIHQYVEEADAAWANGQVQQPTWPLLIDGVNPNLYTISVEHEGYTGEAWTEAMLAADVALIREIVDRWGIPLDRSHVIGHNEIDSVNRANCPGAGLDWDRLMRELRGGHMATDYSMYPRPKGDTGVGFHAGANAEYPLGRPEHWALWIQRVKAMGGTWLKMMIPSTCKPDANEAPMRAVKAAVDAGLMVVVRLHRDDPNPGTLTPLQVAQVPVLTNLGVPYFEVNNEPNLKVEWKKDDFGQMAREVVGRNWVTDATEIVAGGGWPGLPAMSPGGDLDDQWFAGGMLAEIVKTCPTAVLAKTWWACHNYCNNHPIDFPFDDVNVNGTPVSAEEFAKYAWPFGQTREQVNAERAKGKHALTPSLLMEPGMSNGFCKPEMLHKLLDVPIIVTEGGAVDDIGFSSDKRYPVMDLAQHAIYSVETARRMMWNVVPSYVLCGCMNWLLANRLMENPVNAGFESHSWWPVLGGMNGPGIPSVAAMIAMAKQARPVGATPPAVAVPAAQLLAAVKTRLETFAWGEKEAFRRGYVPFMGELGKTIDEVRWYAQPARKPDGSLILLVFKAGEYTSAQTVEIPFTL